MKLKKVLLICLAALSLVSGYLMSKISLVGRTGMSIFYREYNFLRSWWKGALLVFVVLMILFAAQGFLQKRVSSARRIHMLLFIFAAVALYFTYNNFRHDLSYRWMGERFHLGVYLFWVSWMFVSLYYVLNPVTTASNAFAGTVDEPTGSTGDGT